MTFVWREYLAVAEALTQTPLPGTSEAARCRSAVSRAYYVVYGEARTHAQDHEGLQLSTTGDAHQQLRLHYQTGPTSRHRTIGTRLHQLRRVRNQADYADHFPRPIATAQWALRQARQALRQLQTLPPPGRPSG